MIERISLVYIAFALYFVRSGNINVYYGYLRLADFNSRYWSRSGYASTNTYHLDFSVLDVNSSDGPNTRYYGFSLRCLQE